ncbi:MAG: MFS transporter [Planctomycetota bacterium]|nr:MFS transporter [Planctomycetota bacterium]
MSAPQEHETALESQSIAARSQLNYKYFPGWTMLGIAAAAQYMSAPGQSYSVAAFKDSMRVDLRISETDYSLAYTFATVVSACLLPIVGRLVDRFGARIMLPVVATGLGVGCWAMSHTESLTDLYLGFSCVRSLGQGALSLVSVWIVGEWFERRRGIATAMAGLGGGLSVMTIPLINIWLIEHYSWQTAWQGLAFGVWGLLVLPGIFLLRDRPEDLGLQPDGQPSDDLPSTGDAVIQASQVTKDLSPPKTASPHQTATTAGPYITSFEDSWTVRETIRDRTFWKLLAVPATSGLVGTGLIFHQVALLGRHGLTPTWAILMMTLQAGFATLLQFPIGWLTDKVPSRYILAAAMLVLATANVLVINMPAIWLAGVYAFLLGLHGSVMRSTATVVWINYYGRAHQGAVRGVAWAVMIMASALGPLPLAVSIDQYGTYDPALFAFLTLPIMAAIAVWTAHPPTRKS